MITPASPSPKPDVGWGSTVKNGHYDVSSALTSGEHEALAELSTSLYCWRHGLLAGSSRVHNALLRLLAPLRDAMLAIEGGDDYKDSTIAVILKACYRENSSFWAWDRETWCRVLGSSKAQFARENGSNSAIIARQLMAAAAYLLELALDLRDLGSYPRFALAIKIFGAKRIKAAVDAVSSVLNSWNYTAPCARYTTSAFCELLLFNRSPYLEDVTLDRLGAYRHYASADRRRRVFGLGQALVILGVLTGPLPIEPIDKADSSSKTADLTAGPHSEWLSWIQRWDSASPTGQYTRRKVCLELLAIGRWLQACHPNVTSPEHWDRELGIAYVAAIDRTRIGDFVEPSRKQHERQGQPISPATKKGRLARIRAFFRDCQNWGWIPVRFDPARVFAPSKGIKILTAPACPRTIAPETWARLIWAGLNLTEEDLPPETINWHYPIELQRALAAVWLFAGLRINEIFRLRVGCIRWEQKQILDQRSDGAPIQNTVCLIDVPMNAAGKAFTKPVSLAIGEAIAEWEKVRPVQVALTDRRTGELVHPLFCYRGHLVPYCYLNQRLIPRLCRKAQVPLVDARGSITSRQARPTVAKELFNAPGSMSLFELQAWLGQSTPANARRYVALESSPMVQAYVDAGYFAQNKRTLEALANQDAMESQNGGDGELWPHYDVGHGICNDRLFAQCPHRMACIRCNFFLPKESDRQLLLEAKLSLQRTLQEATLTDEERAATDQDLEALDRLIARTIAFSTASMEAQ